MQPFYRFEHFSKMPGCVHAVTKKDPAEPCVFSLALHTGEAAEKIIANREKAVARLGVEETVHFVAAEQTHSDHIEVIRSREARGWEALDDAVSDCDALITDRQGVILTILTADCVPILLYDAEKKVVAAVHAGWRGTKAQIAAKTVQRMKDVFGCRPEDIAAGIAPSIGKCCYEVGKDVASHFFGITDSVEQKGEKYMLDLPYINKYQLLKAGLTEANIEMSGLCTSCEVNTFFSYRKEQGCSGRFMSMIGLR